MKIWVDADATPKPVKEILFRAAQREKVTTTLVANQGLSTPNSPYLKAVQVSSGFDVADNYIVQECEAGDIVITADIPLAAEVVEKGALAINPRGEKYTRENIRQRLAMRDFMEQMRSAGEVTGGPKAYNQQDRQAFANSLDRLLAQARRMQLKP
ncbi:YaiI/YqxD family protein [Pseudomaricurvus alkylphenolicus]|uniref:YaiI/YqxD family protein n=1 Tax=Pseudomaricurvus alkylphenolicus TaxID=1306991 RepID=UPI0014210CEA|nr:YaiI/YqxD family protein [Pseudomaricurvus alkylphenolicus]NIB39289.1 YaiI/YqxD family protein [Pseudomaricurvus alkylphenolicus]